MRENKKGGNNPDGRPMQSIEWITPERLEIITNWSTEGYTQREIAMKIGIAYGTWFEWKKRHPELSEAMKKGLEAATQDVVNAMYRSALGYHVDEVTEVYDDAGILVEKKVVKKYVAPNSTAQIFWAKNRDPENWRDRKQHEVTAEVTNANPLVGLSTDELKAAIDALKNNE